MIDKYAIDGTDKKAGMYYVALCLELNVSSQGESIEEARRVLQEACEEYLSYIKKKKREFIYDFYPDFQHLQGHQGPERQNVIHTFYHLKNIHPVFV